MSSDAFDRIIIRDDLKSSKKCRIRVDICVVVVVVVVVVVFVVVLIVFVRDVVGDVVENIAVPLRQKETNYNV